MLSAWKHLQEQRKQQISYAWSLNTLAGTTKQHSVRVWSLNTLAETTVSISLELENTNTGRNNENNKHHMFWSLKTLAPTAKTRHFMFLELESICRNTGTINFTSLKLEDTARNNEHDKFDMCAGVPVWPRTGRLALLCKYFTVWPAPITDLCCGHKRSLAHIKLAGCAVPPMSSILQHVKVVVLVVPVSAFKLQ